MKHPQKINITPRDRLLRAWENSMELVRDFECYAAEIENNPKLCETFSEFAKDEGFHAARFRELLLEMEKQ
ncbi:MAG: rubrerythrin [Clostridia bacterium]|nr:rubrerythrin [Clostridia bacterium]